ncbi:MAG: hypothetical protein DRJ29_18025, partial [Bacteroidetes bacterium]
MAPGSHKWLFALGILSAGLLRACYLEQVIDEPEERVVPGEVLEFDRVFAFADMESQLLLFTLPSDTVSSFSPHVGFGSYHDVEIDGFKLKVN